jgi:TonB family protein
MGYQALLFCPEEKLARVVSQVFSELDFTIEPVHEPFAAVKKLMTQRYDAIVVDCENEQNASLLFKSARNSSSNQSSLAIALVEGQAGVAKAYRIGANLVLTKPINVEQAKGTLRVARGLLRKNSDAAGAAATSAAAATTPVKTAPVSDRNSFQPATRSVAAIAPPSSPIELSELEAPLSAVAASADVSLDFSSEVEDKLQIDFAPAAHNHATSTPEPVLEAPQTVTTGISKSDAVRKDSFTADPTSASVSAQSASPAVVSVSGSAAATAPAKEVTTHPSTVLLPAAPPSKENKIVELEPVSPSFTNSSSANPSALKPSQDATYGATPTFGSLGTSDAPTFGALGEEDSGGSGGNKKIVIAAAAVLALAALGYLTFGKLGYSNPAPVPQSVSAPSEQQTPSALAPMSSSVPSTSTITVDQATVTTQPVAPKTPATTLLNKLLNKSTTDVANSPVIHIAADAEPATKKPNAAPILVKTNPADAKPQSQAEESAPALAGVPANDSSLSGLMSSAAPSLPKPSLATLRISQGVSQGLLIKKVQPQYPQAALAVHAQGAVQIEATVNKEGSVINPKVLSGDPILGRAALEAVRQWRYKPYYLDGQPVEIQTQITINFKTN